MIPIHPDAAPRMRCGGCGQDDCPCCREYARSPRYRKARGAPDDPIAEPKKKEKTPAQPRATASTTASNREQPTHEHPRILNSGVKTGGLLLIGYNTADAAGQRNRELADRLPVRTWFAIRHPAKRTQPPHDDVDTIACNFGPGWRRKAQRAAMGVSVVICADDSAPADLLEYLAEFGLRVIQPPPGATPDKIGEMLTQPAAPE